MRMGVSGLLLIAILLTASVSLVEQEGARADEKIKNQSAAKTKASKSAKTKKAKRAAAKKNTAQVAMQFARQHHPELADLLENLRESNRPEFQRAVKQIAQASERLEKMKERFPERHQWQLEAWKLDSRIRLLSARMMMSDDTALETELRELIAARLDVRLNQYKEERGRLSERVEKLESLIQNIENKTDDMIERDLRRAKKRTGRKISATGQTVKKDQ